MVINMVQEIAMEAAEEVEEIEIERDKEEILEDQCMFKKLLVYKHNQNNKYLYRNSKV